MVSSRPLRGQKIAYVSVGGFSGVTRTMKQARTVAEAGADVVFVGYSERIPAGIRESGFRVIEIPFSAAGSSNPHRYVRVAYNLTLYKIARVRAEKRAPERLIDAIAGCQPSVVQSVDLPGLACAVEGARRVGAKVVFDSHEMWTGFLDNPEVGLSDVEKRDLLEMEKRYAPQADAVFVVSDEMGRRMSRRYELKRVLTVFNSPPGFKTRALPVHDPVRLVFHGSLAATKNVTDLIVAMKHLGDRATLDIHGAGLTVDQSELLALIREHGLGEIVRLHGPFRYDDVLDMLEPYDVDVYAARMIEENFAISLPNKVFDAICAGVAVAASDFPAIREIVETAGCGIVLDPSTPETIAGDLARLLDDTDTLAGMKARSIAFAPQCSWDAQGENVVACLQELLAEK